MVEYPGVVWRKAMLRINQKQTDCGFLDGQQGLRGHLRVDAFFMPGNSTGIDSDKTAIPNPSFTVLTVAGQARHIRHDGITGSRQAIEEGRFSHIGPTDKSYYWLHRRNLDTALVGKLIECYRRRVYRYCHKQ